MEQTDTLYSIESEQAVLGTILREPASLTEILPIIADADIFHIPKHKVIYNAILELNRKSIPPDHMTVAEYLSNKNNDLAKCGDRTYLIELVGSVISTANVKYYADILLEKYNKRRLYNGFSEIIKNIDDYSATELIGLSESLSQQISDKREKDIYTASDSMPDIIAELDNQIAGKSPEGLTTYITKLNYFLHFLPGDFIILAGRPSQGKSALLLNLAEHFASIHKKQCLLFSLEMPQKQLFRRLLLGKAHISSEELYGPDRDKIDWNYIVEAQNQIMTYKDNLLICDNPSLSSSQIVAIAKNQNRKHKLDFIGIDYVQMIYEQERYNNRHEELTKIITTIGALSKQLEIPVVLCSQFNREGDKEDAPPSLKDLKGSGSLEERADIIVFPWHEYERGDKLKQNIKTSWLIIGKNRNGATGRFEVSWQKKYTRFENIIEYDGIDTVNRLENSNRIEL